MEQLLEDYPVNSLEVGSIVEGEVVRITSKEVHINLGAKSEGVFNVNEMESPDAFKQGDTIEIYIEWPENILGCPLISYEKARYKKNWEGIINNYGEESIISGLIKQKIKGGFIVDIGIEAFLPASLVDLQPSKDLSPYVGKTYDFKVLKIYKDKQSIIISRRELLEDQRQERCKEIFKSLKKGDRIKGQVKNITDYGAFIDLGFVDGLLHVTDMSWGRFNHPSELLKLGEEVETCILEVDYEKNKFRLDSNNAPPILGRIYKTDIR